ncbi:SixA phosphatase family protein [Chryseolinea lacunae]|uniref:Histidine phosphatase family protein n=1 Tax=Chryseolinea lacunae TaxID=2801331 RepID=A0ABS1KXC0_9BACT|nr:histidine phosphatase family protein [Chryseolinea lacunae]MBL0744054.1 histidine phosphatase family protein [Chryseolinea lacunae]
MTRHLYLLRHAESAEKQAGQSDKERSLTPRGMREAVVIGTYLYQQNINVDAVLTSVAERAQDTARYVANAMKIDLEKITITEEIYEASSRTFFQFLSALDDKFHTILIIGHNPVISYVAEYVTQSEIGDMATGGLATIKFNISSWKEVTQGNGSLENYVSPSMLDNN